MTMNRKVLGVPCPSSLDDAGLTDLVIRATVLLRHQYDITTCANHERLASIGCERPVENLERLFVGLIARIRDTMFASKRM